MRHRSRRSNDATLTVIVQVIYAVHRVSGSLASDQSRLLCFASRGEPIDAGFVVVGKNRMVNNAPHLGILARILCR